MNSIVKSKVFEREAARLMSKYTSSLWKRVPNSGGLAAQKEKDNTFQGDLYSHDHPNLIVECKHWKELTINDLYSRNSLFWKAAKQARMEAQGKDWLLLIKTNNRGVLAAYNTDRTLELEGIITRLPLLPDDLYAGELTISKVGKVK